MCFINKLNNSKNFYLTIIISVLFLNTFFTNKLYASSFKISNVEIHEKFDLNFNKKKVFEKAFKTAFIQLTLMVTTSKDKNKLENTKSQLEYFENNKARLMSQLENLNNIVSESNVIGSPFDTTISKVNDKSEVDKKITNEKQITQNQLQKIIRPRKIINPEEMNRLTKDIFKT